MVLPEKQMLTATEPTITSIAKTATDTTILIIVKTKSNSLSNDMKTRTATIIYKQEHSTLLTVTGKTKQKLNKES
jgi:hypothetical protein